MTNLTGCIVALILIPCFLFSYISEYRKKAKERKRKARLMRKLVKEKYDSSIHGDDRDWSICLEYFKDQQKVVILPCDERHFFHSSWVKQWFLQDLTCPLWKDKIDINKINNNWIIKNSIKMDETIELHLKEETSNTCCSY